MRRGWFIRVASQEGFERAVGRTADPSTSLRDDKGERGDSGWSCEWPQAKQQVPPLRFAPVGMTILSRGRTLFRCIYSGHYRIVVPTEAKCSGGTCCFSCNREFFPVTLRSQLRVCVAPFAMVWL
jgi:hypothetical protein